MRLVRVLLLIVMGAAANTAANAQDCAQGQRCGPVPWRLPALPAIVTPTLQPTPTPIPGGAINPGSPTAIPTISTGFDSALVNQQLSTLQHVMAATPVVVVDAQGTPVSTGAAFADLGTNATAFFGLYKAIGGINIGKTTPLLQFAGVALVLILTVTIATFALPVFAAVFGMIRKVIQLILEFLPL